MANIKIAELQSSLLEEVSVIDLDAVHGGGTGVQVTAATSATFIGFTNGGSSLANATSQSVLQGTVQAFRLDVGSATFGITSPT
ncbi:MAG: hypothetical protein V7L21_21860 [Nostoc sp.]|uniref:hypothetical protein n=1 Tax=unclassified Nostoc TaxID=2593658 RepID=UPI0025D05904|nr:hypothetical protein [Nostoc sp. NMS9]MBN3941306.1 hypothetical protein [Nostoc sp. NMS9]